MMNHFSSRHRCARRVPGFVPALFAGAGALVWLSSFGAARAQTLTATADAHVTDNVGDKIPNHFNFGAINYLLVQNDPARAYKTYLRFDLGGLFEPAPAPTGSVSVRSATLALTFSRFRNPQSPDVKEADTISVFGLTDNDDAWTEGTQKGANDVAGLTWNNAPHNDKTTAAALLGMGENDGAPARLLGAFSVPRDAAPGADLRLDVTAFVRWALKGGGFGAARTGDADRVITFVLVHTNGNAGASNNGVQFYSRENTAGPAGETLPALAPRLTCVLETLPVEAKGIVTTVVDAETLLVRGVGSVRLAGIAALRDPKRKPQPGDDLYGDEADRACRRLAAGQRVRLEFAAPPAPDSSEAAAAGTRAAWVFLPDGALLNEQLVSRGYARSTPAGSADTRYGSRLGAAEDSAKKAWRGLWPRQP